MALDLLNQSCYDSAHDQAIDRRRDRRPKSAGGWAGIGRYAGDGETCAALDGSEAGSRGKGSEGGVQTWKETGSEAGGEEKCCVVSL